MAKIFLDANYLISLVEERKLEINLNNFHEYELFISPLSVHILNYLYKYKIPSEKLINALKRFNIVNFDKPIVDSALLGPTSDFEDNVQLHSAAEAECDIFLTEDRKLLDMKFFGKVRINPNLH